MYKDRSWLRDEFPEVHPCLSCLHGGMTRAQLAEVLKTDVRRCVNPLIGRASIFPRPERASSPNSAVDPATPPFRCSRAARIRIFTSTPSTSPFRPSRWSRCAPFTPSEEAQTSRCAEQSRLQRQEHHSGRLGRRRSRWTTVPRRRWQRRRGHLHLRPLRFASLAMVSSRSQYPSGALGHCLAFGLDQPLRADAEARRHRPLPRLRPPRPRPAPLQGRSLDERQPLRPRRRHPRLLL